MIYYWRSQGKGSNVQHVPQVNEREHSNEVEEWISREEQAGQEIPEYPVGAENAADSVGYAKVIAKELDPEATPLIAPYAWARTRKGSTLKTVSREAKGR